MNHQPLQYASLKAVILFLEPSFRLHLSCRLPSIRSAEKGTPLQIDNLRFKGNTIVVNDTKYQLSVYRKYHVERPPVEVSGTVYHDLDEYGFKQPASNDLLPGDVRIGTPTLIDSKAEEDTDDLKFLLYLIYGWSESEERDHNLRQRMLPFEYRHNKQKSPCDLYYQLTIRTESTTRRSYHIPYTDKLHIGMKTLMEMLFGKRQDVWKVDYMHLDVPILRWPVSGILPIVRKLRIGDLEPTNLDLLKSIIHPSSFPLNTLEISISKFGRRDFGNKMITEAKFLRIYGFVPLTRQLVEIQNSNVHMRANISRVEFCELVLHWLQHGCPVGTCFTFYLIDQYKAKQCYGGIITLPEVMERSARLIKLSMNNSLVLVVTKIERNVFAYGRYRLYWTIEMKVVQRD